MTGTVAQIWRHPIKAHGRERIARARLTEGQTLPFDRHWAIAHDQSDVDGSVWAACQNFSRGAKAPRLAAIDCTLDEATATLTLRHPDLPEISVQPDRQPERLLAWAGPLIPDSRAPSTRVVRGQTAGFTDSAFPSVSLCNSASHRAVEQTLGQPLSIHRWRGNIWLDGVAPWDELDWIGQDIRIGTATLRVEEPVERCLLTHANPETGVRDQDILGTLDSFGHRNFAVLARVIHSGDVAEGAEARLT